MKRATKRKVIEFAEDAAVGFAMALVAGWAFMVALGVLGVSLGYWSSVLVLILLRYAWDLSGYAKGDR